MKFIIVQEASNNVCTWTLVSNAGSVIAHSATFYNNISDAQDAVKAFKVWTEQAPVTIISHADVISHADGVKDWRQLAKEQLKKTPWQKG